MSKLGKKYSKIYYQIKGGELWFSPFGAKHMKLQYIFWYLWTPDW